MKRESGNWLEHLTSQALCTRYPIPSLAASLAVITILVLSAGGTLQQILFILFGAPVLFASLTLSLAAGEAVAVYAGLVVTLGRYHALAAAFRAGQWVTFFFEGIFVPLFYLGFCLVLAVAILNERRLRERYWSLSQELARANHTNEELFTSTIQALAATIDAKDPYTRGHSERVTRYAVEIARALHLSEEDQRDVFYASTLHDIGKIGVRGVVLAKPDRLTPHEYKEVKQHPAIGANILSSINLLHKIIPLVYHHHEWYNGAGYPEGKGLNDIPLGARIIAVADAYDAMTSDRPYRPGLTPEQAAAELRRCAGTQFDPQVVEAFLEVLERRAAGGQAAAAREDNAGEQNGTT